MKILIFLIITLNLYSYLSKNERYPREYTYYERQMFKEIAINDNKKWPPNIKFIRASLTFAGTPQERLYMKKSIEEINKIFKSVKCPIIRLTIERDIYDYLPAWTGYHVKVEVTPDQIDDLNLGVLPNIREWEDFSPNGQILGSGGNSTDSGLYRKSKIVRAIATVFCNLIPDKEEDFYYFSYLDHKRVYTFTHELMHALGFANHIKSGDSVMNVNTSRNYIRGSGYTHGPLYLDVIFLEMKYNELFDTYEKEEDFIEKFHNNKLRRPDRRSRKEKLLNPIID